MESRASRTGRFRLSMRTGDAHRTYQSDATKRGEGKSGEPDHCNFRKTSRHSPSNVMTTHFFREGNLMSSVILSRKTFAPPANGSVRMTLVVLSSRGSGHFSKSSQRISCLIFANASSASRCSGMTRHTPFRSRREQSLAFRLGKSLQAEASPLRKIRRSVRIQQARDWHEVCPQTCRPRIQWRSTG